MVIVVVLFLQAWRASIIPLAAVPVSLVGTFAVMHALGFSINNLSLFGLVLAIGIVVDDAIVVVEDVERDIRAGIEAPGGHGKGDARSDRTDHCHGAGALCGLYSHRIHQRPDRSVLQTVRDHDCDFHGDFSLQFADPESGALRAAAPGTWGQKDTCSRVSSTVCLAGCSVRLTGFLTGHPGSM